MTPHQNHVVRHLFFHESISLSRGSISLIIVNNITTKFILLVQAHIWLDMTSLANYLVGLQLQLNLEYYWVQNNAEFMTYKALTHLHVKIYSTHIPATADV